MRATPAIDQRLRPYRMLPIDSLVPYANNARTHSPARVDMLASMIKEYGWTRPVFIGTKRRILVGHGAILAARKLGETAVPTLDLSHLNAKQQRAYILADNQSALKSGWDDDLLKVELGEFGDKGFAVRWSVLMRRI